MNFVNDFPFQGVPEEFIAMKIKPVFPEAIHGDVQDDTSLYRFTANIAREASTKNQPVASDGNTLISDTTIELEGIQIDFISPMGTIQGVSAKIVETRTIKDTDIDFEKFMIRFLNRYLDELFYEEGASQDERFFWQKEEDVPMGNFAVQHLGVNSRVQCLVDDCYVARIDYGTRIVGKQTVWELIQADMQKNNITDWRDLDPKQHLSYLGKIYRVFRATYADYPYGSPIFRTFYFDHLNTSRSVTEPDEDNFIPANYQEDRGRTYTPKDQPVIMCRDRRSRPDRAPVACIPSQLTPVIGYEELARISSVFSHTAQSEAQPNSLLRYQEIIARIEFLLDKGVLDYPQQVQTSNLGPVTLRISKRDDIEIAKDVDFRQIFTKNLVFQKPSWDRMVLVYDERDQSLVAEFLAEMERQFKLFKLPVDIEEVPFQTDLQVSGSAFVRDFSKYVGKTGETMDITKELLTVVRPIECRPRMKFPIKRELTVGKQLATQFITTKTIDDRIGEHMKKKLINPLFMQLVLKMGGCVATYKIHNKLKDTIIIGLDRHRTPGKVSVNASAVAMATDGKFLSSFAPTIDSWPDDAMGNLKLVIDPLLENLSKKKNIKRAILLREGGPGTFPHIPQESEQFLDITSSFNLEGVFITANKSSGIRIFEGDPRDDDSISTPPQYTGVFQYPKENCFVVTTTQTIRKDRGTPLPMQYQIHCGPADREFQLALMQTLAGLSRVGTLSWRSTRLPMPLHYADTLAKFIADVETTWPQPIRRPLFL